MECDTLGRPDGIQYMEAPVNIIMFYSFSLLTTQSHQFVTNITNNSICIQRTLDGYTTASDK